MTELNNYDILFVVSQEVTIIGLDIHGRIEEISIGYFGINYRIGYWNNGEKYSTFVSEYEIKART